MFNPTSKFGSRAAIAAAAGLLAGGIAAAEASAAMTIDLPATAPLVQKLYVPLSVTVACDPPDTPYSFLSGGVTIRQVVRGREIAHGTKAFGSLVCDGSPHPYGLDVFPDPGTASLPASTPFKKGDAVISGELFDLYGFGERVLVGPQTIRLN